MRVINRDLSGIEIDLTKVTVSLTDKHLTEAVQSIYMRRKKDELHEKKAS